MHLVIASGILGMGKSPSALGQTLALLITFLGIGVLVNALIVHIVGQVLAERRETLERMREYDARHGR
jgi:hypothetical protein